MNRNVISPLVAICTCIGLGNGASAGILYTSAARSIGTRVDTSSSQLPVGSGPISRGTSGLEAFAAGAGSWISGDYFVEARAWQNSIFSASSLLLRGGADWNATGFPDVGSFAADSYSRGVVQFQVSEPTSFFIILSEKVGGGVSAQLAGAFGVHDFTAPSYSEERWEGVLEPGAYTLTAQALGYRWYPYDQVAIGGGWFSIGVGVPAPGTLAALGLVTVLQRRRSRA